MARTTGILFLHLSSLANPNHLTKIISAAVQKVENSVYVHLNGLPHEQGPSFHNKLVNQIYYAATRNTADSFDTTVILTDVRDALMNVGAPEPAQVKTNKTIDTCLTFGIPQPAGKLNLLHNRAEEVPLFRLDDEVSSNPGSETQFEERRFEDVENRADENKVYQHVVLGGTFDRLHAGHKMLLSAAILRCKKSLTVGVTDGVMTHTKKLWELIEPCEVRIEKLLRFLKDVDPRIDYKVVPITDTYGPTAYDADLQVQRSHPSISFCD